MNAWMNEVVCHKQQADCLQLPATTVQVACLTLGCSGLGDLAPCWGLLAAPLGAWGLPEAASRRVSQLYFSAALSARRTTEWWFFTMGLDVS